MPVSDHDQNVVESLFRAMQMGPGAEELMMSLFLDDATFIEPFSGQMQAHTGIDAIRESFQAMWKEPPPPPDMKLSLQRVDIDGDVVRADWNCASPVFPEPMRRCDLFTIRSGKISRLEVVMSSAPPGTGTARRLDLSDCCFTGHMF